MTPALELADIFRIHGPAYLATFGAALSAGQKKALRDIAVCRTAALGGHVEQCDRCGHRTIAYCSCRNRHCPKCQSAARAAWLDQRAAELLPVEYFHVVFTLPKKVAPVALQNQQLVYGMLFRAAAETLLQIAADPKHLGARIGFVAVLHTWGQNLHHHPHLRRSRRWHRARPFTLDCLSPAVSLAREGAQSALPRQVCQLPAPSFSSRRAKLPRPVAAPCAKAQFHHLVKPDCPKRMGGLRQTTVWWTATSPEVPGALYPSRGDRQPAPGCASGWSRELSLEGLYARQPARHHDAAGDRVHSSFSAPRAAPRLCEDPPLWLPC